MLFFFPDSWLEKEQQQIDANSSTQTWTPAFLQHSIRYLQESPPTHETQLKLQLFHAQEESITTGDRM